MKKSVKKNRRFSARGLIVVPLMPATVLAGPPIPDGAEPGRIRFVPLMALRFTTTGLTITLDVGRSKEPGGFVILPIVLPAGFDVPEIELGATTRGPPVIVLFEPSRRRTTAPTALRTTVYFPTRHTYAAGQQIPRRDEFDCLFPGNFRGLLPDRGEVAR